MNKKNPWHRNRLIRDGIYRAIESAMDGDPSIYIMGEGSHMKMHFDAPSIEEKYPERILTLPISEDGNNNFAVGLSLAGITPIVDVISSDFLYRAMDSICNTMAKAAAVGYPRTMIVRAEFMTGGPTSGQRIEALFAHIPGLRVAIPSNPIDAEILMAEALKHRGVTIFFEDRMIEDSEMPARYKNGRDDAEVPQPARATEPRVMGVFGPKATVVSYGITQRLAEDALENKGVDLIDLRHLYPLNIASIVESAKQTKKLLVIEPDTTFLGIGAEIVAQVAEQVPGCKFKRLGQPHTTIPACRELHDLMTPSPEKILAALEELTK